jgi:hypothetical protein
LPYAGITPAKPSSDHTPLGGFVSRRQKISLASGISIWLFQTLGAKGATGKTGS